MRISEKSQRTESRAKIVVQEKQSSSDAAPLVLDIMQFCIEAEYIGKAML